MNKDLELKCNFLSVDKKIARNSYGEFFKVGEEVGHEGLTTVNKNLSKLMQN